MKTSYNDEYNDYDDYEEDTRMYRDFAVRAMEELEKNGVADLLLLRDDTLRAWWKEHKDDEARKLAAIQEMERIARVKAEAMAKLSTEEREVLGLAKKSNSQSNNKSTRIVKGQLMQEVNGNWLRVVDLSDFGDDGEINPDWDYNENEDEGV
jgi:hypothetical protein